MESTAMDLIPGQGSSTCSKVQPKNKSTSLYSHMKEDTLHSVRTTCYKPQRWLWRKLLSMIHHKYVSKYNLHVQDVKKSTKAQHKILRPMASITLHPSLWCWNILCDTHQFCFVTPLSAIDSLPESLLLLFSFLIQRLCLLKVERCIQNIVYKGNDDSRFTYWRP